MKVDGFPAVPHVSVGPGEEAGRPLRILVVIPTLGQRLQTLGRTLASIRAQGDVAVDALLVAGTRTAELTAVADRHRAGILVHPGNISAAVNAGFAQARDTHRYACWLGDDDMLRPGALARASALLERHPAAIVAYGACDYVDIDGQLLFNRRPPPQAPALLQFVPGLIKQETCLFRVKALQHAGGLDERLKYTMDLDLLLRLRRLGPFVEVAAVQAAFCWHAGSITIANRQASLAEAQAVQSRHARGLARWLGPLWKPLVRWLVLAMSWKISRGSLRPAAPTVRSDGR